MSFRNYWRNIFQKSGIAPTEVTTPLVNSIATSVTNPAPTLASQGTPLLQRTKRLQLTYKSSLVAGAVSFRVWFFLPSCGWYLEDAIGAAGTVTIAAITDPQRALIIEYPGERIYIESMTVAVSTLTICAFEGVEA